VANSAGSRKRARQASLRSMVRTYIKKVRAAIDAKSYDEAQAALTAASPFIDKMVTKGIMHKNKAARTKSRLNVSVLALKG